MRPSRAMCGAVACVALLAQHPPAQTEPEKIEPAELEHMLRQSDPEMKLRLLDRFWKDYQRTGLIHWAFEEICNAFEAAGQPAGALAAGEKLLALDPQDIEIAQKSLKIAEDQKDAALIEKWSAIAARYARGNGAVRER